MFGDISMSKKVFTFIGFMLVVIGAFPSYSLAAEHVLASWYGGAYVGKRTASGERLDARALTAAHPSLPFGTWVQVRRLDDGRSVMVRINDRCGRCGIDLSRAAADRIGLRRDGRTVVSLSRVARIAQAD